MKAQDTYRLQSRRPQRHATRKSTSERAHISRQQHKHSTKTPKQQSHTCIIQQAHTTPSQQNERQMQMKAQDTYALKGGRPQRHTMRHAMTTSERAHRSRQQHKHSTTTPKQQLHNCIVSKHMHRQHHINAMNNKCK